MQPQQTPPVPEPSVPPIAPTAFAVPQSVNISQNQPSPAPVDAPAPQDNAMPAMADDGDLIEKEWVGKVEDILTTNGSDPYEQSRQLSQLKADYMQKRYGKVIQAVE